MPEVSVIVPNYNHAEFLEERLDSILNQTFKDYELILLDDCSTDNSLEILNSYSQHPQVSGFIINKKRRGTFKQWDKGIKLSIGEFIWIAESDDVCEPEFLEKILPSLRMNKKAGLAYCQSWSIDNMGNKTGNWLSHTDEFRTKLFESDFIYKGTDFVNEFLLQKNVIPNTSAIVFRKSVYQQTGGVNSHIEYCGDWFLWMKMAVLSDVCFISKSLNYFRRHENSVIFRALNTDHLDKYHLQKSDKKMRQYFSSWLKTQQPNLYTILEKNNNYISKVNIEESIFYIYHGSLVKSIIFAIKYFFITGKANLILFPVKRFVKRFHGTAKRI